LLPANKPYTEHKVLLQLLQQLADLPLEDGVIAPG
jgi:hypothetical protein